MEKALRSFQIALKTAAIVESGNFLNNVIENSWREEVKRHYEAAKEEALRVLIDADEHFRVLLALPYVAKVHSINGL